MESDMETAEAMEAKLQTMREVLKNLGTANRVYREEQKEWRAARERLEDELHKAKMGNMESVEEFEEIRTTYEEAAKRCKFLESVLTQQRDDMETLETENETLGKKTKEMEVEVSNERRAKESLEKQLVSEREAAAIYRNEIRAHVNHLEEENELLRSQLDQKTKVIASLMEQFAVMQQKQDLLETRTSMLCNTTSLSAPEYHAPDETPPPAYHEATNYYPPVQQPVEPRQVVSKPSWGEDGVAVVKRAPPPVVQASPPPAAMEKKGKKKKEEDGQPLSLRSTQKAIPVGKACVTATNKKVAIVQEKEGNLLLYDNTHADGRQELLSKVKVGGALKGCCFMDNICLVVADYKVKAIDVSDPRKPGPVMKMEGFGSDILGLMYKSPYCYVSAKKKLKIFEMKKEKKEVVPYPVSSVPCQISHLRVYNHLLYGINDKNIVAVNISDITEPTVIRTLDMQTPIHGFTILGSSGLVCTRTGLKIIDITNPERPHITRKIALGTHIYSLDVKGNSAYYVEETGGKYLFCTMPLDILLA
eukprot:TRINITY_DN5851_c0_g1_i1.p1 TRINITY_DN5851_c0_g1~~TRINITY_DN5851_c0_g1_i1.p1  ORF type:complete len:533 (+),score=182.74 TRINITY_DN5851_c0_g1_i1:1095-2693(+)